MDDLVRTETLWRTTRDILRHDSRITPQMLGFLELAEAQGIINETLYLEVPNDLARSMLDQRIQIPASRQIDIDLTNMPMGTYVVQVIGDSVRKTVKVVKQ